MSKDSSYWREGTFSGKLRTDLFIIVLLLLTLAISCMGGWTLIARESKTNRANEELKDKLTEVEHENVDLRVRLLEADDSIQYFTEESYRESGRADKCEKVMVDFGIDY